MKLIGTQVVGGSTPSQNSPNPFTTPADDPLFANAPATLRSAVLQGKLSEPMANGDLPLHYTVKEGLTELIPSLIEKGADPAQRDDQNLSALDHSVLLGNEEASQLLLSAYVSSEISQVHEAFSSISASQSL